MWQAQLLYGFWKIENNSQQSQKYITNVWKPQVEVENLGD